MRHLRSRASIGALLSAAALLAGNVVRADIIPSFEMTAPNGGNTTFSYSIDLSGGSKLTDAAGSFGKGAGFFTIYDFNGYVGGSAFAPADWTITTQAAGITPIGVAPVDTGVVNITFTYTGALVLGPVTHYEGTGVFGADSIYSATNANGAYASHTIKNNPSHPDNNSYQGNLGSLVTPSAVPETSSLMLLLPGLVPLGVMMRRRARK